MKKYFLVLFILFSSIIKAQPPEQIEYNRDPKKRVINLPNYDDKKLHYGFFLGLNANRSLIDRSSYFINSKTLSTVTPVSDIGFSLGFLMNIRLHDQLSLKFIPSVGFYDKVFKYTYYSKVDPNADSVSTTLPEQRVETTFLELSILLKYKSIRRKNHRFYVVGGVKPSVRVGGKSSGNNSSSGGSLFDIKRTDFAIEYGAGIDFYFQYFKFSPELRFSHGILNMNAPNANPFNLSLADMLTHTVTLYFFFE